MVAENLLNCDRVLRFRVLDKVTFVKNTVVPIDWSESVVATDLIGSNHDVCLFELILSTSSLRWSTYVSNAGEERGVLLYLLLPMARECRRAYDQRWQRTELWCSAPSILFPA